MQKHSFTFLKFQNTAVVVQVLTICYSHGEMWLFSDIEIKDRVHNFILSSKLSTADVIGNKTEFTESNKSAITALKECGKYNGETTRILKSI